MAMRLSGLQSGMDTESVIQQLVEARSTKVKKAKNDQTKLGWKQEIWKGLNTKLKTLQSKLNDLRFAGGYAKKTTKVSDSSVASVLTSDGAAKSVQALKVKQLAKTAYLTGGTVSFKEGTTGELDALARMDTLMNFEKDDEGNEIAKKLTLTTGTGENKKATDINLTSATNISDVLDQIRKAGLNASFDANQKRFYINAKESGEALNFEFGGDETALKALGLGGNMVDNGDGTVSNGSATYLKGQDSIINLNGVDYVNNTNVHDINGLTITALSETEEGKSVTLTTDQDTDGIYDMIKDFFKTYNEVINEIDKLYNADSAKNYEPLSDEEKQAMSETEVEKYEQKIKDSLLRRDSSLNNVGSALRKVMLEGVSVNGKQMYLSNFGIETLNYFTASDNERNAYHINGDPDDSSVSGNEDELKKMIATDPDTVVSFFSQLTQNLYTKMSENSSSIEGYRSFGSFYDDKKMKEDYDDYKIRIKELEDKLADYEDKWYAKFAAMETAMAKMQNSASAVTSLLGGSQ